VKEHAQGLNLFVSTQANICSWTAVKFWRSQGAKLCILGREVTFAEAEEIREKCPDILLETFMHGAMCMSYSGRCLISNYLADRSANKGKCAHCCRWHYKLHIRLKDGTIKDLEINENNKDAFEFFLEEDFRPGEYYEIVEDEHGGYMLNSKDMCLMPRLNQILSIGMDSLKVEGRNKTEYYAGTIARAYRQAIDDYYKSPEDWDYTKYMHDLQTLQNRGYCLGFHDGKLTNISQNYEYTRTMGEWLFAGSIVEWQGDDAIFELRNYINAGEFIEFLIPNGLDNLRLTLTEFEDAETAEITPKVSAGQGKKIRIKPNVWGKPISEIKKLLPQYTIARKIGSLNGANKEMFDRKQDEFDVLCNG
jgi:putative protease